MDEKVKVKHNLKDGIFRYLFKDTENFVKMYEVFTGKKILASDIEFKDTDSIVMSKDLKNDISFLTKDEKFIILVEHQASKCQNIGLRMLIYYAELLKMHIKRNGMNVYGTAPIKYPKAEFYVAYNGQRPWAEDHDIEAGDVTIHVKLVDINYDKLGHKEKDNPLSGYAYLVKQFEHYKSAEGSSAEIAVDKAFGDCRGAGYLVDYIDREEFLTMVTERWTVEQQAIDRERWAREEARAEEREKAEKELEKERKKAKEEKIEIAKNFINHGVAIDIIASSTNLSKAEILKLKAES